jgi:hypothetical protein
MWLPANLVASLRRASDWAMDAFAAGLMVLHSFLPGATSMPSTVASGLLRVTERRPGAVLGLKT